MAHVVIVRDNVIENIAESSPKDGAPPMGSVAFSFDGFCSIGWMWNDGAPSDPAPPLTGPAGGDESKYESQPKASKALLLAAASLSGKTQKEAAAAFDMAWRQVSG